MLPSELLRVSGFDKAGLAAWWSDQLYVGPGARGWTSLDVLLNPRLLFLYGAHQLTPVNPDRKPEDHKNASFQRFGNHKTELFFIAST